MNVPANRSNQNTVENVYANGNFKNVNEVHNNTGSMVLNGFNQEGGKVTGNIGKVEVISRQNTSTTTGSSRGMSLGISANGVPSSVNINGSRTNGDRAFVDNQSTFIVGEGSSLHVGTLENTGAVVGKQGNSTFKIDSYIGKDIQNHDTMKTTGGSLGISTGKPRITNVGFNQDSRDKQGITRNTVAGDVEIGETSGSPINRDITRANEVTKDTHSSTNINVESQTIEYATNPAKLKEDIGKAKDEINDIKWAIDKSIHDMGHDNRNFFGQLSEVRLNKTIDNITSQRLIGKTVDTEIAGIFKDAYKDLGYDIEIIFSDPKNSPQLLDENDKPKTGTAYVRDENGKKIKTIIINGKDPKNATKAGLIGTIVEEGSHVIGKVEGRQRKTGTDEKGLESTGRASNEYFTEKYKDDNTPISIHSDGKDYSNVDFGENVGDYHSHWEAHSEPIKRAKKNLHEKTYRLGDQNFINDLTEFSRSRDIGLISPYFGFYFLPVNIQKKYMSKDEDGDVGLRIDAFDPKGFEELKNKREYTIGLYKVNIKSFERTKKEILENGIKNNTLNNENVQQNFVSQSKILGIIPDSNGLEKVISTPEKLDITYRTGSIKSKTTVQIENWKKDWVKVTLFREYKLYDDFKKPYDFRYGLPYSGETGTPYKLLTNYQKKDKIFTGYYRLKGKTEREKQKNLQNEVINSLNIRISDAINNIKKLGGNPKNAK